MQNRTFYNEILTEHNLHPTHKHPLIQPSASLRGVNPSCGDDITLQLKMADDGSIEEGAFNKKRNDISQASADMMLDLVIGRTPEEALKLKNIFMKMIKEKVSEEELEMLEEASSLQDISHMPARVKCAVLGWRTLEQILEHGEGEVTTEGDSF